MQKFSTLADCVRLAEFAHFNQTDKAGLPYIEHPRRVLKAVQTQGALPYVQMAAILHDVTEDTRFTPDMLLELGVLEPAVEIIRLVDRGQSAKDWASLYVGSQSYPSKDDYYYYHIGNNNGAKQVKLADIGDNLQPWRLAYLPSEKQKELQAKYSKALGLLND